MFPGLDSTSARSLDRRRALEVGWTPRQPLDSDPQLEPRNSCPVSPLGKIASVRSDPANNLKRCRELGGKKGAKTGAVGRCRKTVKNRPFGAVQRGKIGGVLALPTGCNPGLGCNVLSPCELASKRRAVRPGLSRLLHCCRKKSRVSTGGRESKKGKHRKSLDWTGRTDLQNRPVQADAATYSRRRACRVSVLEDGAKVGRPDGAAPTYQNRDGTGFGGVS